MCREAPFLCWCCVDASRLPELRHLIQTVAAGNPFYAKKWNTQAPVLNSLDDFTALPLCTKHDFTTDQDANPPYGTNFTGDPRSAIRLHQSSGTTSGRPLRWRDSHDSWQALLECWKAGFSAIGLLPDDVLFFPFSFGPFLGFWTAFEAAGQSGFFALSGGGMNTATRLQFLHDHRATVLFTTPTYALHLLESARATGLDLVKSAVRLLVLAGEPGASVPAMRQTLGDGWGATVLDHYGLTEVGPVAFESVHAPGSMSCLASHYFVEVLNPENQLSVPDGECGELVITTLKRIASPVIRYRTGDLVKVRRETATTILEGGITGRIDDMIHVRGNNVYPSAIEAILRSFPSIAEYRIVYDRSAPLSDLLIEIEPHAASTKLSPEEIRETIAKQLLFRASVKLVPPGTLPRFEFKARRFIVLPTPAHGA